VNRRQPLNPPGGSARARMDRRRLRVRGAETAVTAGRLL
jgi:hypothetical protein